MAGFGWISITLQLKKQAEELWPAYVQCAIKLASFWELNVLHLHQGNMFFLWNLEFCIIFLQR